MNNKIRSKKKIKQDSKPYLQNVLYWQLFIVATTLAVYFSSFSFSFVNWDDTIYVLNNPYIHSLSFSNISDIFGVYYNGNYHPLTMLSYAVENAIAGQTPFIYHFTNVLFHLANTLLVFIFVKSLLDYKRKDDSVKSGLITAVIASLLFGVHPLHVESVSWISERKDVLYTFFFLIALISYLRYIEKSSLKMYFITLFVFLLSLLSKGMAVTFSVTILAVDYVLQRDLLSRKVIVEKIPFFVLSAIFGYIAIEAQVAGDAILVGVDFSFLDKLAFASYGLTQYLLKMLVPFNLCHYYPYPADVDGVFPLFYYWFPFIILTGLVILVKFFRKSRLVIFGFMFFLINIFLVLKFISVGDVIIADRYTYLSSVGFFIVVALLFEYLFLKYSKSKTKIAFVLIAFVLFIGVQAHQRTMVWKTSFDLWDDANSKYPNLSFILANRAFGYLENGSLELALTDYRNSIKLDPHNPENYKIYADMGNIEHSRGNYKQSIELYTKSLAGNSDNELAYIKRGEALINVGRPDLAYADFNKALEMNPSSSRAYKNRGIIRFMQKDYYGAIEDFNTIINHDPTFAEAFYGRGLCYLQLNKKDQACKDMYRAAGLNYKAASVVINNECR